MSTLRHIRRPALLLIAWALLACANEPVDPGAERRPGRRPRPVTLMTFNVDGLFDSTDDPGKDDQTYLPLAAKQTAAHQAHCAAVRVEKWRDRCLSWDWDDARLRAKLAAVARAILQVGGGRGPDVLALQEVENLAILERLRTEYLGAAGYGPGTLIEGQDARGIDQAFLSRLPIVGRPRLHPVPTPVGGRTRGADRRGILAATFELPGGGRLTGFNGHFPSPFNPTDVRVAAFEHLGRLRRALPADHHAFAAGDFNVTTREDRAKQVLERFVRPFWIVAHEQGCAACRGTSYHGPTDAWDFLDMILWAPASQAGPGAAYALEAGSATVARGAPGQIDADGHPADFDPAQGTGVSDHWPLVVTVEPR